MKNIFALICGAIFGMGLYKSGMTDTTKVQGWLDIFGDWDPTLAFVLGGAIIPMTITWQLTKKIKKPVLANLFPKKPEQKISKSLIIGSISINENNFENSSNFFCKLATFSLSKTLLKGSFLNSLSVR